MVLLLLYLLKSIDASSLIDSILMEILVGVTTYYTYFTYHLLKASNEQFYISNRPYITLVMKNVLNRDNRNRFILKCSNVGKTPARILNCIVSPENEHSYAFDQNIVVNPSDFSKLNVDFENILGSNSKFSLTLNYVSRLKSLKKETFYTKYDYQYNTEKNTVYLLSSDTN